MLDRPDACQIYISPSQPVGKTIALGGPVMHLRKTCCAEDCLLFPHSFAQLKLKKPRHFRDAYCYTRRGQTPGFGRTVIRPGPDEPVLVARGSAFVVSRSTLFDAERGEYLIRQKYVEWCASHRLQHACCEKVIGARVRMALCGWAIQFHIRKTLDVPCERCIRLQDGRSGRHTTRVCQ